MGRHQRDFTVSTWYHVINRGADRQDIYSIGADFRLFEQLMEEAFDRFAIELHAYALMTNHFHLLVNCPAGNLSEAMQRLCGRYGSAYNGRAGREGPVLTGRFLAIPVTDDGHVVQVGRYIHRNPLAFVEPSQLVRYPWASLSSLCGRRARPPWLVTDATVLGGMNPVEYAAFVLQPQPFDVHSAADERPRWIGLDHLELAVAETSACSIAELRVTTRGRRHDARMLVVTLAVELRVAGHAAIAERFQLAEPHSVRRLARQGRVRLAQEAPFADLRNEALGRLGAVRRLDAA